MAVGVWQPGGGAEALDAALLQRLAAAGEGRDEITAAQLEAHGLASHQWLMRCEASAWDLAAQLPPAQLESLIRFFTLAEAGVPGWEAGAKSPVIPLVKLLKARDAFTPDLRKWIRSHTDNRYLPHGAAL